MPLLDRSAVSRVSPGSGLGKNDGGKPSLEAPLSIRYEVSKTLVVLSCRRAEIREASSFACNTNSREGALARNTVLTHAAAPTFIPSIAARAKVGMRRDSS